MKQACAVKYSFIKNAMNNILKSFLRNYVYYNDYDHIYLLLLKYCPEQTNNCFTTCCVCVPYR